ncbi:Uncharacterised protein [Vibrio cholerae]|uniref:Uncharacterized protein n=1 Tax=Vibrio cholerae TaxID=666 RepID=A0A656AEL0_VIBCL|nr:Uncharacterised protein [Vibrio cholerae]CSB20672.1 Uncharacterised protein [Vibrio cholerae]CSC27498.1 Uncharacterised protein [Vibrio cholerae]CSC41531.1 Uncharacterised protein [Vibrio cholerae]CSC52457.1 Uncharacterised protein [Vibrio cholerae]
MVNQIITIDRRVHFWVTLQRFSDSFHVERHKAQTNAMTFFEHILVLLTHVHDRFHVHFIKRRQHSRVIFRFQQTLSDTLTQTCHWHALFTAADDRSQRCDRGFSFRSWFGFVRG